MELSEVKRAMNHKVLLQLEDGAEAVPYIMTGCIMRRRKDGTFFYQAELTDPTAKHSIVICRLEDIQKKGE